MLTLTSPVRTPWHGVPAGAKLIALCLTTIFLFWLTSPPALAAALGVIALLHLPGGPVFWRAALAMLRPLWLFAVVVLGWHLWTGAAGQGLAIVLRMVAAVAAANLVTMTTRLSDMLTVVERICAPLSPLLPPRRLALAVALVIRFIPALGDSIARIREAWTARSPRRPGWRILVPAVLAALDDAEHAAEALRARGGAD